MTAVGIQPHDFNIWERPKLSLISRIIWMNSFLIKGGDICDFLICPFRQSFLVPSKLWALGDSVTFAVC